MVSCLYQHYQITITQIQTQSIKAVEYGNSLAQLLQLNLHIKVPSLGCLYQHYHTNLVMKIERKKYALRCFLKVAKL